MKTIVILLFLLTQDFCTAGPSQADIRKEAKRKPAIGDEAMIPGRNDVGTIKADSKGVHIIVFKDGSSVIAAETDLVLMPK